jgi:hypothetical protein
MKMHYVLIFLCLTSTWLHSAAALRSREPKKEVTKLQAQFAALYKELANVPTLERQLNEARQRNALLRKQLKKNNIEAPTLTPIDPTLAPKLPLQEQNLLASIEKELGALDNWRLGEMQQALAAHEQIYKLSCDIKAGKKYIEDLQKELSTRLTPSKEEEQVLRNQMNAALEEKEAQLQQGARAENVLPQRPSIIQAPLSAQPAELFLPKEEVPLVPAEFEYNNAEINKADEAYQKDIEQKKNKHPQAFYI